MSTQPHESAPVGSIGAAVRPGTVKALEECGELAQVLAKLLAFPDTPHPDGTDLDARLIEEMGDVIGTLAYLRDAQGLDLKAITARAQMKVDRFWKWHHEERDA